MAQFDCSIGGGQAHGTGSDNNNSRHPKVSVDLVTVERNKMTVARVR